MEDLDLGNILPKLMEVMKDIYSNTEEGSKIASSRNYHLPSIGNYLLIANVLIDILGPDTIALCRITGRVHAKWHFHGYYLFVEPIPNGDMYNISIVPLGLEGCPSSDNEIVTLDDLIVILLLHALSNKVSINNLNTYVNEISKIKDVVCKKPLIKASSLPRA